MSTVATTALRRPVAAAFVVIAAETMVALVLAGEALRKFGGDSVAEFVRNRDGFLASLR